MPGSGECFAEKEGVKLNWKGLEIIKVASAVLMPSKVIRKPFIALEAELSKVVSISKVCLIAVIDMGPPGGNVNAVTQ